jgi:hypothetical protein
VNTPNCPSAGRLAKVKDTVVPALIPVTEKRSRKLRVGGLSSKVNGVTVKPSLAVNAVPNVWQLSAPVEHVSSVPWPDAGRSTWPAQTGEEMKRARIAMQIGKQDRRFMRILPD